MISFFNRREVSVLTPMIFGYFLGILVLAFYGNLFIFGFFDTGLAIIITPIISLVLSVLLVLWKENMAATDLRTLALSVTLVFLLMPGLLFAYLTYLKPEKISQLIYTFIWILGNGAIVYIIASFLKHLRK